jgi:hypothetical protein
MDLDTIIELLQKASDDDEANTFEMKKLQIIYAAVLEIL